MLKRGQNIFDEPKIGIATKTIPDLCNKNVDIIREGYKYQVMGIYHYENEVPDNYMIKTTHSYALVHLSDLEISN